jgi:hypothetical protein
MLTELSTSAGFVADLDPSEKEAKQRRGTQTEAEATPVVSWPVLCERLRAENLCKPASGFEAPMHINQCNNLQKDPEEDHARAHQDTKA